MSDAHRHDPLHGPVLCVGLCYILIAAVTTPTEAQQAPRFKYDGSWPKLPLPNKWTFGGVTGLTVDSEDVIWVLHRPNDLSEAENFATLNPPTAECCVKAPAVLAFDVQGNLKHAWDGPAEYGGRVLLFGPGGSTNQDPPYFAL